VAADAQPSCSHSSRRKEEEARNGTLPPFGCFITTAFKDRSVPVRLHVSRIMLQSVLEFPLWVAESTVLAWSNTRREAFLTP